MSASDDKWYARVKSARAEERARIVASFRRFFASDEWYCLDNGCEEAEILEAWVTNIENDAGEPETEKYLVNREWDNMIHVGCKCRSCYVLVPAPNLSKPPCVSSNGRTDCHGKYIESVGGQMVCMFCKEEL